MRPFYYHHIVTLDETSVVGNVYFAHFVHWQGHCRERFLAQHAPGVVSAIQRGDLAIVTVSCSMNYYTECFALDTIDVAMTLRMSTGNRLTMDFEFRRGSDLAARGTQTVACMRRTESGVVPIEIPLELSKSLVAFA
ncbi:MAG TPA: acyl-CoA thioesterase [Mycobacterium sp.]|nr:acyl-CoA thioesterase [Mycobacterium sp.]HTX95020.1 acyl-CoA thioesterase [Mycobacterium sp.]